MAYGPIGTTTAPLPKATDFENPRGMKCLGTRDIINSKIIHFFPRFNKSHLEFYNCQILKIVYSYSILLMEAEHVP